MPFPPPLHKAQVSAIPPVIVVDSQAKNSPRCLRRLNARPVVRTATSTVRTPGGSANVRPDWERVKPVRKARDKFIFITGFNRISGSPV